jgi:sigma-E factor negative regulatory protein RseA
MNKESREHISSLMDGEISRETGRFVVRRLGADQELSATWARYHLVRDCLRHQHGGLAHDDLVGRTRRSIEREALAPPSRRWSPGWVRPAMGLAVAASVALMAIVAVGPGDQAVPAPGSAGSEVAERSALQSFTSPNGLTPAPATQQASLLGGSASSSRMNAYLLRHYQATGATGGKGFVSFVPIVVRPVAIKQDPAASKRDEEQVIVGEDSTRSR